MAARTGNAARTRTDLVPAAATLAATLRRFRRERGLTMREMAAPLHLAAHSAVADFESGRRLPAADILAAYERHFDLPSGTLLALRQRALAQRAAGEPAAATPRAGLVPAPRLPVPAQLPHNVGGFVGREAQLQRLLQVVEGGAGGAPAVAICSIDGIAGVGKSALAVHFAHRVAEWYPDGHLHIDLRGHAQNTAPMTPLGALGQLLRALGENTARLPVDVDELAAHYRSVLAGRRVLVLLDNATDTGQVRPLLPGSPGCLALVTSRHSLAGLVARDGAQRIMLGLLSADESVDLLVDRIGAARVAREPGAAAVITRLCGYLPLALRIAAEQATARPALALADLAAELADERKILSRLAADDDEATGVRATFALSYRSLPEPLARFFRLLALHAGDRFTVAAAAAVAGVEEPVAQASIDALAAAHLVEPVDDRYHRLHDLLRIYAMECVAAKETPDDQRTAVQRMAGWYLHTAQAAARQVRPGRRHADLGSPPASTRPRTFSGYNDALDWLDAEHSACAAAADAAARAELDRLACGFPAALYDIFELRGLIDEWQHTINAALGSARRLGDVGAQATMLSNLAIAHARTGRYNDALELLQDSLVLRRESGDRLGQAATLGNIANVLNEINRPDEALPVLNESAVIHRELGNQLGEAMSLGNLGVIYGNQRRSREMIEVSERALDLFRNLDDRPGEARALSNLATAYAQLHDADRAIEYGGLAAELSRACGARDVLALALRDRGRGWRERGDIDQAVACWHEALSIFEELGDPVAEQVRADLRDTSRTPPGKVSQNAG